MKTLLTLFVLIVAAGAGGAYYYHTRTVEPPKFRTLPVTRGDLLIGVAATGTVEPVDLIDVGAQIVGSIKSFGPDAQQPGKTIDYRSHVKQGAILAQLDDAPHKAELEKAKASLALAEAELKRAQARQRQTERDFRRAESLRDTNSAAEYDAALAEYEIAKEDLGTFAARVDQAKVALQQAEINLGYTVIRSPVDGVVIDRRVNVGQTVVAGLNAPSLFLMAKDLSHMRVWAAVNEADIGDIQIGQKVTFKVDAYRDLTFTGKVAQIRLNAGLQQNVVTYGVVVDIENRDGKLLPYMTAKLRFEVAERSNVVLVPNQALRWRPTWEQVSPSARDGLPRPTAAATRSDDEKEEAKEDAEPKVDVGAPAVWVVADDGLVRHVPIKTGLSDGMVTEVTGGELKPETAVVVGVLREAKADFVSSFITKVTKSKK
jgi:HlyD family secretion protein